MGIFLLSRNEENKNFFSNLKLFENELELIGVTQGSTYEEKEYECQKNKSKKGDYIR